MITKNIFSADEHLGSLSVGKDPHQIQKSWILTKNVFTTQVGRPATILIFAESHSGPATFVLEVNVTDKQDDATYPARFRYTLDSKNNEQLLECRWTD